MRRVHPLTGRKPRLGTVTIRTGGSTGAVGSYGMTRNGGNKMHHGTDYLCDTGDPVFAAHDGRVLRDGFQTSGRGEAGRKGYGSRLTVQGDGVETRYAHLSGQLVRAGDEIYCGALLGWTGRSGNVDEKCPTHLHFEVRRGNTKDSVDPEAWLHMERIDGSDNA